jgi:hypothetical protein
MVSGELVGQLLRGSKGRIAKGEQSGEPFEKTITDLYWSALSRQPSVEELTAAENHIKSSDNSRRGLEDVAWALLNSNEFLFRR